MHVHCTIPERLPIVYTHTLECHKQNPLILEDAVTGSESLYTFVMKPYLGDVLFTVSERVGTSAASDDAKEQ